MHSVLENFYNIDISQFNKENYELKVRESVQKLFMHYWNDYKKKIQELNLNKDQERFYFEETMLMILNWANHFIEDWKNVIKKKNISLQEAFLLLTPIRELELKSEKYAVKGFIDAIHHHEDEVHILDYKTNASFEFKDSIILQLAIYSLLYKEVHGKLPAKIGIFFLRHKAKWMDVDESLLDMAKREIEFIHGHTSSFETVEHYPKTITSLCKWSSGQCDFYEHCKPQER